MSSTVTLTFDSASPQEAYNLTLAFQRTLGLGLPQQVTTEPTVKVGGSALGWTSPRLTLKHAEALLAEFRSLQEETVWREAHGGEYPGKRRADA